MAGGRVTSERVEQVRKIILDAGLTWEQNKPNTVGKNRLAAMLNCGHGAAGTILDKLRRPDQVSTCHPPLDSIEADPASLIEEKRYADENRELRRKLNEALSQQVLDQRYQEFIAEVAAAEKGQPKWIRAKRSGKARQAMPFAHLSDAHFDEVVDPRQVNWLNAYNREIAVLRLQRFFDRTIHLCDDYLKGVEYPGIVMPVSGDMFSGAIHEELRETNQATLCESLRFWIDHVEAGIKMFADRFGHVYIPWIVGNHPRLTQKPRAKGGVKDNFDWLLGAMLQRDFARAGDKRVQFEISDSFDLSFTVYQTDYLQTHGDQFRGGTGIAAELSPLLIGEARKRERQQVADMPFDVMICGHWHRRNTLERVKMNGSLKGYDEYALTKPGLRFQSPQQSFWLDTPERGITFEAPLFVEHPNENWRQDKENVVEFSA